MGKRLPTIYHWIRAARTGAASYIILLSNFRGEAPARAGDYQGMSPYGTYDMAGNVNEWCWNKSGKLRYILGGAWSDPTYMFTHANVQSSFDRSATHGFRCVRYLDKEEISDAVLGPSELLVRDYSNEKPVPEPMFRYMRAGFRMIARK